MQNNELEKGIEAVLFWKGEPVSIKKLSQIFSAQGGSTEGRQKVVTEEEILTALKKLEESLMGRGVSLIWKEDEVALGTSKDTSELIEKLTKEELVRDLGRAGLETLSIIIYQGPISRAEIDYIRGVQSTFILRNLMIRGLVEKVNNPKDQRSFLYKPTFELLSYMGITKIEEMPEFKEAKTEIESYKNTVISEAKEEEISTDLTENLSVEQKSDAIS